MGKEDRSYSASIQRVSVVTALDCLRHFEAAAGLPPFPCIIQCAPLARRSACIMSCILPHPSTARIHGMRVLPVRLIHTIFVFIECHPLTPSIA